MAKDIPRCTFDHDMRCLKNAGCVNHGIECMRRTAAFGAAMGWPWHREPEQYDRHITAWRGYRSRNPEYAKGKP